MVPTKNCVDGQSHALGSQRSQIIEAKTGPVQRSDPFRFRRIHAAVLAALIASAVFVPQFLLTFLTLSLCVVMSLIGFVFLVQMPVRFFASRLRNRSQTETTARAWHS